MEKASMVWRLVYLLLTIQEVPGLNAAALAQRCEMSTRSVYRHVNLLRMAGAPIITDRGYRVDQELSLSAVNFTLSEVLALALAGQHFTSGKMPFNTALADALRKISLVLPESLRKSTIETRKHVLMGHDGPIDYSKAGSMFGLIETSIKDRVCLAIKYRGLNDGKLDKRLVDPFGLVYRQGFWYLVAYCRKRKAERLFRLDRIADLAPTGDEFAARADFSLSEYMRDAWSVMKGEPRLIKVRFTGIARRIVKEGKWHSSQKTLEDAEDGLIVVFEIGGLPEISSWLLGFGGDAEVLEPIELRQLVAQTALAAACVNR